MRSDDQDIVLDSVLWVGVVMVSAAWVLWLWSWVGGL